MKLSEAMMLGDSLRARDWSTFLWEFKPGQFCGCALGGATLACGRTGSRDHEKLFPWLRERSRNGYTWADSIGTGDGACDHPNFSNVVEGPYTFEQLVDWVRSIEPECGECNRFECTCKPAAVPEAETDKVTA